MKKSLILVGMFCVGYATAQTYDGKVGINTDAPSATLNVKSKTGTTKDTKNFELSNANGTVLLSAFDDGHIGIGTNGSRPYYKFQVQGGSIMTDRDLISQKASDEGGSVVLSNPSKKKQDHFRVWTLYNTTGELYGDALHFHGYTEGNQIMKSMMSLFDDGNLGVGTFTHYIRPTERLDVQGNARFRTLPDVVGTSRDKIVVVDDMGVLKSVERNSISTEVKASSTDATCSSTNVGAIHYKEIQHNGNTSGVFGFCMKKGDEYVWGYMLGGSNIYGTSDNGAVFGQGL